MTKIYRTAAASVTLALAAALAGCADDPSARTGGVSSATPSAMPSTSVAPTEGARGSEETATDAIGCLHGTWTADNTFFLSAIRSFGDEVKSVTGEVVLTFAPDGALTTEYRDWRITAVSDGVEMTITRTGTDLGRFEATGSTVTLEDTELGSSLVMSAAGTETAVDPAPVAYTDAPYTCDASGAEITTPDGALRLLR